MSTDPVVAVARDLRAIVDYAAALEAEAIAKANDALMPGGLAMVALGHVATASAYTAALDDAEQTAIAAAYEAGADPRKAMPETYDDDDWEPPLQTLLFWSEAWRLEHGYPMPKRPTEATEANFLRWALDWAWDNEPHWDDFADDVATAKARMENLLREGERPAFRGVPCLYDECKGARLIRKTVPTRDKKGRKVWRLTDWHCPKCKRSWSEEDYTRNIYAAIQRDKIHVDADDTWCTVDHAAMLVKRPEGTVRSWVSRAEVAAFCTADDRKRTFVLLADVRERDRLAKERHARWLAARKRRETTL